MAPPKKTVKRLDLRVTPELYAWIESQIPEKGANAQQVAISILENAEFQEVDLNLGRVYLKGVEERLEKAQRERDALEQKSVIMMKQAAEQEAKLAAKEERLCQYQEEVVRGIARAEAQEKHIEELTRLLDRVTNKLEPKQIASLDEKREP